MELSSTHSSVPELGSGEFLCGYSVPWRALTRFTNKKFFMEACSTADYVIVMLYSCHVVIV